MCMMYMCRYVYVYKWDKNVFVGDEQSFVASFGAVIKNFLFCPAWRLPDKCNKNLLTREVWGWESLTALRYFELWRWF